MRTKNYIEKNVRTLENSTMYMNFWSNFTSHIHGINNFLFYNRV